MTSYGAHVTAVASGYCVEKDVCMFEGTMKAAWEEVVVCDPLVDIVVFEACRELQATSDVAANAANSSRFIIIGLRDEFFLFDAQIDCQTKREGG